MNLVKKLISLLFFSQMIMIHSLADTIHFSAKENYTSGELQTDSRWNATEGFIVNTKKGTLSFPLKKDEAYLQYKKKYNGGPGTIFYTAMTFQFSSLDILPKKDTTSLCIIAFQNTGSLGLGLVRTQRKSKHAYQLWFTAGKNKSSQVKGTEFNANKLFTTAQLDSDKLYMELILQKGDSSSDWAMIAKLYNLTKDPNKTSPVSTLSGTFNSTYQIYSDPLNFLLWTKSVQISSLKSFDIEELVIEQRNANSSLDSSQAFPTTSRNANDTIHPVDASSLEDIFAFEPQKEDSVIAIIVVISGLLIVLVITWITVEKKMR